jgi:hypothetical protein
MQVERRFEQVKNRQVIIELPESFSNHKVEIIVLTVDEEAPPSRRPHPDIAGKMQIVGDILTTIPEADWDLPR